MTTDPADERLNGMVAAYDDEAEATGWYGPEVVFGLVFTWLQPGQSILDLGIGTGRAAVLFRKAGLTVHGLDNDPQMLAACRRKGVAALQRHDLTAPPYPFDTAGMDHAVCTGVMNFFSDLSPLFQETARILRKGGLFGFVVGDRNSDEAHAVTVGPEHTHTDRSVTMYRHDTARIARWAAESGFDLVRDLAFTVFMDRERTRFLPARAYVVQKTGGEQMRKQAPGSVQGGSANRS